MQAGQSLRCFWMLIDRHVIQFCAGMFRRPMKHGKGRQGGPRAKVLQRHTHSEARHERHQRCSHAKYRAQHAMHARQRNDDAQITTTAFKAGSPKEVYLCIEDTRVLGHRGYIYNLWRYGSTIHSYNRWAKVWEATDGDARGRWPITKWTYGDVPKKALTALCGSNLDIEILKGIVEFRLELCRVDRRRRLIGRGPFAEGEAEVDVCVLVPKDYRVKFYVYGGTLLEAVVIEQSENLSLLMGERPTFYDRRVGVMYEGIEVATIEKGRMRATKEGIRLQARRCAHDLHRVDENSRLHESRLCADLFAQVMEYVG